MRTGIAIDFGTSGFRAQKVDLDSGEIKRTVITMRNPLPGANVMDHLDFAMTYGQDKAHDLVISAFRNIIDELEPENGTVDRIAICGNPIQLSLFQGIPIDDLAYAGERKKQLMDIKEQKRDAAIVDSAQIKGLEDLDCKVVIPPAIKHEIGADALALIVKSGMLDSDDISIATDYGTNAEMALKVGNIIYTGSAAAGPALEGQEIEHGSIARPFVICDIEFNNGNLWNLVLDEEMNTVKGSLVDYKNGDVVEEGSVKASGITGTGVIALMDQAMNNGIIQLPHINTRDKILHLQDGIKFTEKDIIEAGRAIGAIRAGHVTLCNAAGIAMEDVRIAYMSGAAGTYMDALKAHRIGMIPYNISNVCQIGNTSLIVAKEILLQEDRLWELQKIAREIVGTHVMFATDEAFKEAYILELSYWNEGMPFKALKKFLKKKGLPIIDLVSGTPVVEKRVVKDIPDLGEEGLHVLEQVGTYLTMEVEGCIDCHQCMDVCPNDALIEEDRIVSIRTDLCDGAHCQKCIHVCPEDVLDWKKLKVMG